MKPSPQNSPWTVGIFPVFILFLFLFTQIPAGIHADTGGPYPPPAGKVWIHSGGKWKMVPAPPNEGPYRWTGNGWARVNHIPPHRKWIPPHWGDDTWVTGHWKRMRSEDKTQVWMSGHWEKNGQWIEGHWETVERPSSGIDTDTWIPGIHSRPLRPRFRPHRR